MELTHHLLTQNLALAPTKTLASVIPSQHVKRQAQATSVVHITITAAGTVVYTQTATSYSYVASYSPVTGSDSTAYPTNNDTNNNNNNSSNQSGAGGSQTGGGGGTGGVNTGAIVGGVVGGVALIALIGLGFFLMRRSQKRKREKQKNELIDDDDDSYYRGHQRHASTAAMEGAGAGAGATGMTSLSPAPRHLVAPLNHLGEREGDGRESKYYQDGGGYYDDIVATTPYPHQAFYSGNNSVAASDSLPSTTVEPYSVGSAGFRQVPNEVDYPPPALTGERHVPHLKDDITPTIEPPHTKD
ncbi:hypothetical protein MUCCIDRAFT_157046 [Mucor lusitanicus CBS 277.49]|uniref:Mid2 domain-containing protein n=1 Tax=Mucor lusitanicus CBS 277.49 TaxID=747725 RepID=A0A168IUU2_MUCCL|nr:hypothetical protein MUCCIDRAFT_157046 [Mucor lusitanicus CBS 277.49]